MTELSKIGWREWVALPGLGIDGIKVKVDTGARSSALHGSAVESYRVGGREMIRFLVHPLQRDSLPSVVAEAEVLDWRKVKSSSGKAELRPVILTPVRLMERTWDIELTIASRDQMGFRMLLGRQAVRGRFLVDPGRSYLGGRPPRKKKRRKKTQP